MKKERIKYASFFCTICALCSQYVASEISTNALFSDGAVLQHSGGDPSPPRTVLHGQALPGETITLSSTGAHDFPGAPYTTVADQQGGNWNITIDALLPTPSGISYVLEVSGNVSVNVVTASGVVVGDVFICSGRP